jgi:hypothetical protein
MTISPVKPGGWNPGDPLSHTQLNLLQAALLKAVDGVDGGSYTLASTLSFLGSLVRFLAGVEISDSTLSIAADGELVAEGDATFNAFVELFGTLDVATSAWIKVHNGGTLDLKPSSILTVEAGAIVSLASALMTLSGILDVTGSITVPSAGHIDLENLGRLNVLSGGKILGSAGGEVQVFDAEDLTINASSFVFRLTLTPVYHDAAWAPPVAGRPTWCMNTATIGAVIVFALPLMPGDTLTTLRVTLNGHGVGIGHSNLFGTGGDTAPFVELFSVSLSGVETSIRTVSDPVTGAAYDSSHSITLSLAGPPGTGSLPITVGADPLYVRITSESGTHAVDGTTVITAIDGTGTARSFRGPNEVY